MQNQNITPELKSLAYTSLIRFAEKAGENVAALEVIENQDASTFSTTFSDGKKYDIGWVD